MHRIPARLALATLIVAGTLALTPAVAYARKGGPAGGGSGGSSTLSVVMVIDANTDGVLNYGDTITFTVSTTATTRPYVQLDCSQNGTVVYQHTAGIYVGYPWSQDYVLSSNYWTGGPATCVATLEYNTRRSTSTLATLGFSANA